jgi:hypothetical protein
MSSCNHDCFNCPYPDCIVDDMTAEEYRELSRIERELIRPKSRKELAIAAKKREYREANRESIAAKQREYREANRESIAAKKREYREAKRKGGSERG